MTNTTNVGGISITTIINGNISGDDLQATIDNTTATALIEFGEIPPPVT